MKVSNFIRTICAFSFLVSGIAGMTQITYRETETSTFRYLLEGKWDSLIITGNQALKENIDYAYLRSRLGMAYFEKQKYVNSTWNLERALNFNKDDQVSTEYLYSAYLFSNRPDQARAVTSGMDANQKSSLAGSRNVLDHINIELGGGLSNAFSKSDPETLMGKDSIYGQQNLYGNYYYGHGDFSLNLSPRFSLTLGYSYLSFQKRVMYQYAYATDVIDSTVFTGNSYVNYYSFPREVRINTFNYPLNQNEFFIGATIVPAPGVSIMPAFRFIKVKYTLPTAVYNTWTVQDTSWYDETSGIYYTFPFNRASYGFSQVNYNMNNYLIGLRVTKQAGIFDAGIAISWSNFNKQKQLQTTWSLGYYPLGTPDFYGKTALVAMVENGDGRLIATQVIGAKIARWLWLEGDFLYGDISDGNLDNGMIVYNNPDKVDYRAGLTLLFPVFPNMQVALMYRFFQKESMIIYYSPVPTGVAAQVIPMTREMKYQTNSLFLGIKIDI
jgi:hypothetical protein